MASYSTSGLVSVLRRQVCQACSRFEHQMAAATPIASTSRRTFSSTSYTSTKLVEHKLDKKDDPLDIESLEDFAYNDIPWMGHLKLEKDREKLHLLRLIEFQFPEIKKLQTPYKAPTNKEILKVRTSYHLGDPWHPSSKKAVLSVSINDLVTKGDKLFHNNQPAQHKFKLLAGERWDENKMMFKISSEKFPTFNMNSKWCSDALDRLIEAALDTSDPMTDIPLNLRRAEAKKAKRKASIRDIPREWVTGLVKESVKEIKKE